MFIRLLFLLVALTFTFVVQANQSVLNSSLLNQSLQYLEHDLDKAEDLILKALDAAPEDPEVNFICGRIMGEQAEESIIFALSYAKKSLNCLIKATEIDPNELRYRFGLLSFYLGAPSIAGGDIELASEQVDAIAALDKLQGVKAKIKYLISTGQEIKLKTYLTKASKEYPSDAEIHLRFGLLAQKDRMYEQAYEAFKTAVITNENSSYHFNAMYQLGRNAVLSNTHTEEGIEMLLTFIQATDHNFDVPPISWAYLRLAQLYNSMNNDMLTKKYHDLAYQSDDRDLHRALKKLKTH